MNAATAASYSLEDIVGSVRMAFSCWWVIVGQPVRLAAA
jgi:hypothetical protein